jgi:hypothetical protein
MGLYLVPMGRERSGERKKGDDGEGEEWREKEGR